MTESTRIPGGGARGGDQDSLDVIQEISPRDEMYVRDKETHYFRVGRAALSSITLALEAAQREAPRRILDLPCGYGRVLRFLKAAFPDASLTACDVNADAVEFCAGTFDAAPVVAPSDPTNLVIGGEFDLIWCGSLLTHLDVGRWRALLGALNSCLAPQGVVVFTTNGAYAADLLRIAARKQGLAIAPSHGVPDGAELGDTRIGEIAESYFLIPRDDMQAMLAAYDATGFGYANYSEDDDYGQSLSSPAWVCKELESLPSMRLVLYTERGWDAVQDVVACAKQGTVGPRLGPV
jgi:SAM-dependent methyltransferase